MPGAHAALARAIRALRLNAGVIESLELSPLSVIHHIYILYFKLVHDVRQKIEGVL